MYELEFSDKAERFLKKLPLKEQNILLNKIYSIRKNPFSFLKKLTASKFWRLRIGKYRAIVDVIVKGKRIIVLRIGKRDNVY